MVHPVKPPEGRDGVEHHVLKVDRKIKQHHRDEHREPDRNVEVVEQAPPALFGQNGQSNGEYGESQTQNGRIDNDQREVVGPPDHARNVATSARGRDFPDRHCRKDAQEGDKADRGLCYKDSL